MQGSVPIQILVRDSQQALLWLAWGAGVLARDNRAAPVRDNPEAPACTVLDPWDPARDSLAVRERGSPGALVWAAFGPEVPARDSPEVPAYLNWWRWT